MSRVFLLTFADENFKQQQDLLCDYAYDLNIFDGVLKTDPGIFTQDFIDENKSILSNPRGHGYWLWKPWLILQLMEDVLDGDIVFYLDSGDMFLPSVIQEAKKHLEKDDLLFLDSNHHYAKHYTKRDCFYYMGCDEEKYWNAKQIEAGAIFLRKSQRTIEIVNEWYSYCKDHRILTDDLNTCGLDNFAGFVDHRHDQSILSNLVTKYNLQKFDADRKYVQNNIDYQSYLDDYNEDFK